MAEWRPFLGAWAIWLLGYALLLLADLMLRRALGVADGASGIQVLVTVTVLAGAASGFFLAAGARWSMRRRVLLLALQAPPAYMAAVTMGMFYLCVIGVQCV